MIYVIQMNKNDPNSPIKIGFTSDLTPWKRISTLQTGNPFKLKVIATLTGTQEDEKNLHNNLNRYRLSGEWFSSGAKYELALYNNEYKELIELDNRKKEKKKFEEEDRRWLEQFRKKWRDKNNETNKKGLLALLKGVKINGRFYYIGFADHNRLYSIKDLF
jgi:hypothetical protein